MPRLKFVEVHLCDERFLLWFMLQWMHGLTVVLKNDLLACMLLRMVVVIRAMARTLKQQSVEEARCGVLPGKSVRSYVIARRERHLPAVGAKRVGLIRDDHSRNALK